MKKQIKNMVSTVIFNGSTLISPKLNTQLRFLQAQKKTADLKNPQTFTEKLSWLKLYRYPQDILVKQCADKYAVREYVETAGFKNMLIPVIATYNSPDEIDFGALPDKFVLKWNFSCGYNIICKDKSRLDCSSTVKQLKKWQKNPYWKKYAELHYKTDSKVIICEELLENPDGSPLLDYKFYCFGGRVKAVLVIARPEDGEKSAVFMSPEWQFISKAAKIYKETLTPKKPSCLEQMIVAAEKLSAPFSFVRVDFYENEGKAYFGEMTFTPAAGVFTSETIIDGKTMGELLDIDTFIRQRRK